MPGRLRAVRHTRGQSETQGTIIDRSEAEVRAECGSRTTDLPEASDSEHAHISARSYYRFLCEVAVRPGRSGRTWPSTPPRIVHGRSEALGSGRVDSRPSWQGLAKGPAGGRRNRVHGRPIAPRRALHDDAAGSQPREACCGSLGTARETNSDDRAPRTSRSSRAPRAGASGMIVAGSGMTVVLL